MRCVEPTVAHLNLINGRRARREFVMAAEQLLDHPAVVVVDDAGHAHLAAGLVASPDGCVAWFWRGRDTSVNDRAAALRCLWRYWVIFREISPPVRVIAWVREGPEYAGPAKRLAELFALVPTLERMQSAWGPLRKWIVNVGEQADGGNVWRQTGETRSGSGDGAKAVTAAK
jgi:hypothetical protein